MKKTLATVLKLILIAICFHLIFRKLNIADVEGRLRGATFHLVLLAFLTILSEPLVMAAKWNILLKQKGIKAGYFAIVRILFSSNFLGVTMPSVGMDVIRIYMVKQRNHDFVHATGTLVADRLMAVGVLAMMSLLATPVVWGMVSVPTHVAVGILSVSLLILAGLALAISPVAGNVIKWLSASLGRLAGDNSQHARPWLSIARTALHKGAVFMEQVHISIRSLFAARGRGLLIVFLLNIAVQMLRVTQVHLLFRSVGIAVPLTQELAFVPIIIMLTLLPISWFGLGIKEGAFVFLFSQVGVAPASALAVSFITYPLIFAALLPGAVFLLLGNRNADCTPLPIPKERVT